MPRESQDHKAPECAPGSVSGIDCDEAVHQLYHYLDGELTEDRRREIARHLDACEPCAGAAGFESELRVVIANRCRDRVPDALLQRIADALHEEQRHSGTT
ncbi:MAG TPA: mycothiol system anti-sigma-R factor [Acidimicrobiales bacterium]